MTVRIEARDGEVKVLQHLGFLRIEPQSSRKEVVGELRGFGVVSTPMGLAAGYTRQRWAAIGPECRVVLWLGDRPLDDASLRALVDVAGLCLVDAGITSAQSSLPAVAGPFKEGGTP